MIQEKNLPRVHDGYSIRLSGARLGSDTGPSHRIVVARGGIEPPTRGFSGHREITNYLNYQLLAALAIPHSRLIKAQFRHTQN